MPLTKDPEKRAKCLKNLRLKKVNGKRANKKRSKTMKAFWATPEGKAKKVAAAKKIWEKRNKQEWLAKINDADKQARGHEVWKERYWNDPERQKRWRETHMPSLIKIHTKPNRHEEMMEAVRASVASRTQEITLAELKERAAWALKDYPVDMLPDMPSEYYKEIVEYFRPDLADFSTRGLRLT